MRMGSKARSICRRMLGRGVFSLWEDPAAFDGVYVGPSGSVAWSEEIELCPDSIYLQVTSKKPEEVFSGLTPAGVDA